MLKYYFILTFVFCISKVNCEENVCLNTEEQALLDARQALEESKFRMYIACDALPEFSGLEHGKFGADIVNYSRLWDLCAEGFLHIVILEKNKNYYTRKGDDNINYSYEYISSYNRVMFISLCSKFSGMYRDKDLSNNYEAISEVERAMIKAHFDSFNEQYGKTIGTVDMNNFLLNDDLIKQNKLHGYPKDTLNSTLGNDD